QELARKNFELLKQDPTHPSLHFKKVGDFVSARVGISYRALGVNVSDGILGFLDRKSRRTTTESLGIRAIQKDSRTPLTLWVWPSSSTRPSGRVQRRLAAS